MTEPELRLAVEVLRGYEHDKPRATAILRREGFTDTERELARLLLRATPAAARIAGATVEGSRLRQ